MSNNQSEFQQPVSIDDAPAGSICEWCGKPATHQLTAIGGTFHNESGFFCELCGAEYIRTVTNDLQHHLHSTQPSTSR